MTHTVVFHDCAALCLIVTTVNEVEDILKSLFPVRGECVSGGDSGLSLIKRVSFYSSIKFTAVVVLKIVPSCERRRHLVLYSTILHTLYA